MTSAEDSLLAAIMIPTAIWRKYAMFVAALLFGVAENTSDQAQLTAISSPHLVTRHLISW